VLAAAMCGGMLVREHYGSVSEKLSPVADLPQGVNLFFKGNTRRAGVARAELHSLVLVAPHFLFR
jgi:hypothetical protein